MATLTGEQLKDSYQSLVTIGDSITSDPTSGRLENGKGTALTAVGIGTDTPDGTLHLEASDNTKPSLNLVANNAGQYYDNIITSTLGRNSLNFKNTDTTESGAFGGQISGLISFETSDTDNAGVHSYISGVADASGNGFLAFATGAGGSPTERLRIKSTGDISFRDGSASEAFYWDASAGSLGIGTTSPATSLDIQGVGGATTSPSVTATTGTSYIGWKSVNTGGSFWTAIDNSTGSSFSTGTAYARVLWSNGAYPMVFSTNSTERMRIDSSGKVGIGTTSPTEKLQIVDSANDVHVRIGSGNAGINPTLRFHGKNTADTTNVYADIRVNPDNQTLGFSGTGTSGGSIEQDALVIDSSGKVGIGTTSPTAGLECVNTFGEIVARSSQASSTNTSLRFMGGAYTGNKATAILLDGVSGENRLNLGGGTSLGEPATEIRFHTGTAGTLASGTERMRIDSSGNVLVGKTTVSLGAVGVEVKPNGEVRCTTNGAQTLQLNRLTSDGTIIDFRKDGTTVGSIGTKFQSSIQCFYIAGSATGIGTYSGGIYPSTSDGSFSDGTKDLGTSSVRFKDLYLSGSVGIGGTSIGAKLDIQGTDTEPLTVLNNTVYTFAGNVTTSQSNTHTVTIPFTSQASQHSNFIVEIYASLNWTDASTTFAGRALYTLNAFTSVSNIAELEDVNNGNLSFSATNSGMNLIVTITTTATGGQEPNRIGVMAKVIRGNGSVGNQPTSMTIA
jgi:hypothetical protein